MTGMNAIIQRLGCLYLRPCTCSFFLLGYSHPDFPGSNARFFFQ